MNPSGFEKISTDLHESGRIPHKNNDTSRNLGFSEAPESARGGPINYMQHLVVPVRTTANSGPFSAFLFDIDESRGADKPPIKTVSVGFLPLLTLPAMLLIFLHGVPI